MEKVPRKFLFSPNYGIALIENNEKLLNYLTHEIKSRIMKILFFRYLFKVKLDGKLLGIDVIHYIISFVN